MKISITYMSGPSRYQLLRCNTVINHFISCSNSIKHIPGFIGNYQKDKHNDYSDYERTPEQLINKTVFFNRLLLLDRIAYARNSQNKY